MMGCSVTSYHTIEQKAEGREHGVEQSLREQEHRAHHHLPVW